MADADTGIAVASAHLSDKDLHVIGTTWDSATLVIEGSNDGGTTYRTLKPADTGDVDWEPIDMTDEVPGAERPQYIPIFRRRRR